MRLLLANHISVARESLQRNRLRTTLTTLGIMLGVACITVIMALGFGVTQLIQSQVDALGGNIAIVRPGADTSSRTVQDAIIPMGGDTFSAGSLTEDDLKSIEDIDGIKAAAPIMSVDGSVRVSDKEDSFSAPIVATTPEFAEISDLKIKDGQFIDAVTNQNTAVIGYQLSVDLFGTDQSIGKTFKVRGHQFTVIGILKSVTDSVNYNNLNINDAAIINLSSGKRFNQGIAQIRQINIQANDPSQLNELTKEVSSRLAKNHADEKDFTILTGDHISQPTSDAYSLITAVTVIVSTVALIIGGIGIMNIMLANVAERTREIGIRKAVGASNSHITFQFLIEALAMSVSGGVIGFILGYACSLLVATFLPFNPGFAWQVPAIAIGTSVVVGVLFGLYPAIKAARKNPIEALRQYY